MFHDVYAEFSSTTLPNGLTLWVQPRSVSWVYVGVLVHAGAKEDPVGRQGLAHLVEHLVSENVNGLPFPELEQRLKALGAATQFGTTSYLSTAYDFHLPADETALQEALTLFGRMLLQGQLTHNIEQEKAVMLREYHICYPHALARLRALKGRPWLFEQYPRLGSFDSAIGVLEEWMPCSQSEIQAFYDRYYTPANMTVVCIGACTQEQVLHLLERTPFAQPKPGERSPLPEGYVPVAPSVHKQVLNLSQFSLLPPSQATCTIEWVIPVSFRRYSVFLLTDLLEELLTEQLRYQRALTYQVSVGSEYYQDCRVLTFQCELAPERLILAQDLLWQSLDSLAHAQQRFLHAKQERIATFARMDYSGHDVLRATLDDLAGYQRLIPFAEEWQQLEQTGFAEVVELAAYLTPERHVCFITSP